MAPHLCAALVITSLGAISNTALQSCHPRKGITGAREEHEKFYRLTQSTKRNADDGQRRPL